VVVQGGVREKKGVVAGACARARGDARAPPRRGTHARVGDDLGVVLPRRLAAEDAAAGHDAAQQVRRDRQRARAGQRLARHEALGRGRRAVGAEEQPPCAGLREEEGGGRRALHEARPALTAAGSASGAAHEP